MKNKIYRHCTYYPTSILDFSAPSSNSMIPNCEKEVQPATTDVLMGVVIPPPVLAHNELTQMVRKRVILIRSSTHDLTSKMLP